MEGAASLKFISLNMKKKLLFSVATHGNESIGLEVVTKIKKTKLGEGFDFLIANPRALEKRVRFVDSDLNRVFPGKRKGDYEERRAQEIMKLGEKYEMVIDLHGSASKTGIFIIITKFTLSNLLLALRFNIKKIVIWPGVEETTGSLSTFMPVGLEIEAGLKEDPKIKKQLKKILVDFLKSDKKIDYVTEIKKRDIFLACGKLKKQGNRRPKNLENWKEVDDFIPLFVDGQYEDIWCYKFKKINILKEDLFNLNKFK